MLIEAAVVTALISGAASGLHCSVMCGPLALAGATVNGKLNPVAAIGYFGGRLAGYSVVGGLLGHLGQVTLQAVPMGTVQTIVVAAVALLSLAHGIAILRGRAAEPLFRIGSRRGGSVRLLTRALAVLPRRGASLGVATALLPCGALAPAWLLAAGTTSASGGAAVMACFAVASLPGLAVPVFGRRLLQRKGVRLPASAPGFAWIALAGWMALRPLLIATGKCH